jgi:hypothetical protein
MVEETATFRRYTLAGGQLGLDSLDQCSQLPNGCRYQNDGDRSFHGRFRPCQRGTAPVPFGIRHQLRSDIKSTVPHLQVRHQSTRSKSDQRTDNAWHQVKRSAVKVHLASLDVRQIVHADNISAGRFALQPCAARQALLGLTSAIWQHNGATFGLLGVYAELNENTSMDSSEFGNCKLFHRPRSDKRIQLVAVNLVACFHSVWSTCSYNTFHRHTHGTG